MTQITIQSNAKVNLSLDILGREETKGSYQGYHFVQTVLHEINSQNTHGFEPDELTITAEESGIQKIQITCDDPDVPTDETSPVYKAAQSIVKKVPQNPTLTVTIDIKKNIPIAQGFGGGSSNAAATLQGLNQLLNIGLRPGELHFLAAEIGTDVPFFINGGLAIGEHYGEQITQLPPVDGLAFSIFPTQDHNPGKTLKAYKKLDIKKCGKKTDQTEALLHAIKTNDCLEVHKNLHNDFETILKKPLQKNHHLTGAGPAQFLLA